MTLIVLLFFSITALAQRLIILHTNDHHGHFMPDRNGNHGLAAQATLVRQIREEARATGAQVLVLSGGDINTGAPESNMARARPDIEAMNRIGYDAMVVGNHEFDFPPEVLREQQRLAKFPFLGANVQRADGSAAFTPHITREIAGKRVAIVGFTTTETPHKSSPAYREGLTWVEPDRNLVRKLRRNHDMVIGLSHLGYYQNEAPNLRHIGDEGLARRIPELDLIVGAHTHSELREPVRIGETAIVQARAEGHFVGRVDVDLSGSRPVIKNYQLLPVRNLPQDPEIRQITETYLAQSEEQLRRRVGTIQGEFPGGRTLGATDAPLGNLVAEATRLAANADISISTARGLRAGLPTGEVTYRDVLSVSPFGNTITQADLNGQDLWRMVELIKKNYLTNPNDNMFFSRGIEIEFENNRIKAIRLNGVEVPNAPTGRYRVATRDYLPDVVSDFAFIRNNPTYTYTGITEVEAIEGYFRRHPVVRADQMRHGNFRTTGTSPCTSALQQLLLSVQAPNR